MNKISVGNLFIIMSLFFCVQCNIHAEYNATFTATIVSSRDPAIELFGKSMTFCLEDIEIDVVGLPDGEYPILNASDEQYEWVVNEEIYGTGKSATIYSEDEPGQPLPPVPIIASTGGSHESVMHNTITQCGEYSIEFTCYTTYQIAWTENGVHHRTGEYPISLVSKANNSLCKEFTFFTLELVTPAGDPTTPSEAKGSGDGQNEFTFDYGDIGKLIINLKAKTIPESAAQMIVDRVRFDVQQIEDLGINMTSIEVSGQYLSSKAIIYHLPAENSSFGLKTATLYCDGNIVQTNPYEIFFQRDASNHPGSEKGITPNWYYYWTKITGSEDLAYGGANENYGCYDCNGSLGHLDKCIIYDSVVTKDNQTGPKGKAGIDCFGQTVYHERKHRTQFYEGFNDTTNDGIPDYNQLEDQDSDWLSDKYEKTHGFDKTKTDTDDDGIPDFQEEAFTAESQWPNDSHNNQDWSNPGKNSCK